MEVSQPGPAPTGQAMDAVKLPAIFLIIVGAIGILVALLGLVTSAVGGGGDEAQMQQMLQNPDLPPALKQALAASQSGALGILSNIVMLVLSGIMVFGATKMMKLQSFSLAMAAAIIAIIPCWGSCCCIGIPFGIWALVVLNKPEVKASFT